MMKNIIAILFVSVFFAGCSSPAKNWVKTTVSNDVKAFKSYELNHTVTTVVGDPMIYSHYTKGQNYYKVSTSNVVAWGELDIGTSNRAGEKVKWQPKYIYPGNDGDYVLTSKSYYSEVIGIIANKDGTIPKNPVMRIDKKGSEKRYPIIPYKKDLFDVSFMPEKTNNTNNYELVYSGKSASTIDIVYREYVGRVIKNGFKQHLSYDLSESNIIQFKNTKIRVLKATNTDITFKVLSSDG
jgi:hypothetical protein